MPRRVFFSFHYDRDIRRVAQVRQSWRIRPGNDTQPFYDKAEWESIKRTGRVAVANWIERQLNGTSVTVVLIGRETASREWVLHEIQRSHELGKGMLGVYIHGINDPRTGRDLAGPNPFDHVTTTVNGWRTPLSTLYRTYDWTTQNGYANLGDWVQTAARAAGR